MVRVAVRLQKAPTTHLFGFRLSEATRALSSVGSGADFSKPVDVALPPPSPKLIVSLMEVYDLSTALYRRTRIQDSLACEAWLRSRILNQVVQSAHPAKPGDEVSGTVHVEGASSLKVWLHPRCSGPVELLLWAPDSDWKRTFKGVVRASDVTSSDSKGKLWSKGETVDVSGNTLKYKWVVPKDMAPAEAAKHWGFCFSVSATGVSKSQQLRALAEAEEELRTSLKPLLTCWEEGRDRALLDLVSNRVDKGRDEWGRSAADLKPEAVFLLSPAEEIRYNALAVANIEETRFRFELLRLFNERVRKVLHMVDLNADRPWTMGFKLNALRRCVFADVKRRVLEEALQKTRGSRSCRSIVLDNFKASESEVRKEFDPDTSKCVFVQAFDLLKTEPSEALRTPSSGSDRVFSVNFKGEGGIDAGGVYREGLQRIMEDLFSTRFSLLIPCPNAAMRAGDNSAAFVPNPRHRSALAMEQLEFVGKLMGLSLRFKSSLPFRFPALIWKLVCGETPDEEDLVAMDSLVGEGLKALRERKGVETEEQFAAAFGEMGFVADSVTGDRHNLTPAGPAQRVTLANHERYIKKLLEFRLHEFDAHVAAIRRGLAQLVPTAALRLFTWSEMEVLVSGRPEIDIDLLKRHTSYSGFSKDDAVIKRFWRVLEGLSEQERSMYVRFAWGRSRLPTGESWSNQHQISRHHGSDPDKQLPMAHTCFFSIELPAYTTEERMRWGILTSIHFGGGILNG